MKVTFVTNYYPMPGVPQRGYFIQTQAYALKKLGIDISVIHPVPYVLPIFEKIIKRSKEFINQPDYFEDEGIPVYQPKYFTYPGHLNWGKPDLFQVRSILKLNLPKPDLIHAHFGVPSGIAAMSLSQKWNVKWVLSLRGYEVNEWPYEYRWNKYRLRSICKKPDLLLANSHALAEEARQFITRDPQIITSGLRAEHFLGLPNKISARQELCLDPHQKYGLFIGALLPRKGIHELIEAWKDIDATLLIIGSGPLKDYGASETIRYLGHQSPAQVKKFLCASDMLIHPTHIEGLPNVILEAGMISTPIAASRIPPIEELLYKDARHGEMFNVQDSKDMKSKIHKILADPLSAQNKADVFQAYVKEKYDSLNLARRLIQMYENLIKGHVCAA